MGVEGHGGYLRAESRGDVGLLINSGPVIPNQSSSGPANPPPCQNAPHRSVPNSLARSPPACLTSTASSGCSTTNEAMADVIAGPTVDFKYSESIAA